MRSEEEIFAGELRLRLGGEEKVIRELRIAELREWRAQFEEAVGGEGKLDLTKPVLAAKQLGGVGDDEIDLLLAYDKDGKLGGRAWVEEHATQTDLHRAFRQVQEAAFPFVTDLQSAALQVLTAAPPASPSATNGRSATGASPSTESSKPSPRSS
jgi:hypothetical protein